MSSLEKTFELSKRGSTVRQEIIAGLTTFLAMVYSVIVVPKMLGDAGFPAESVFIATCLVAGRIPVAEIKVNTKPIRNTAPNATGIETC